MKYQGLRFACIIAVGAGLLLSLAARAQAPTDDPAIMYFGRMSVEHNHNFNGGYDAWEKLEVRGGDAFLNRMRLDFTLGGGYQLTPWLHASGYYTFIGRCDYQHDLSARHRLGVNFTASYKTGKWTFSEKESLQFTHRQGEMNTWQNPRNALTLRSRAKVEYKLDRKIRPFLCFEMRNTLNAVSLGEYAYDDVNHRYTTPSGEVEGERGWMADGFHDVYVNRFRLEPGIKFKIDKKHSMTVYTLVDYCYDRDVDISADGKRLKSIVNVPEYHFTTGIAFARKL